MKIACLWLVACCVSYLVVAAMVGLSLPYLLHWHLGRCGSDAVVSACVVSASVMRYWWITVLPVTMVMGGLIVVAFRSRVRRKRASSCIPGHMGAGQMVSSTAPG